MIELMTRGVNGCRDGWVEQEASSALPVEKKGARQIIWTCFVAGRI